MSDTKTLTLLGANTTDYQGQYNPDILEKFENQFPDHEYLVFLLSLKATSIFPA